MPWVDDRKCIGCNICVEKCPANAILMENKKAEIEMEKCIHCGVCHEACPIGAIRHDREQIPDNVKANVKETKRFMDLCAKYLGNIKEKDKCLQRMIKYFNKKKIVAEKTIEELENLKQ
jgi:ferredoxin